MNADCSHWFALSFSWDSSEHQNGGGSVCGVFCLYVQVICVYVWCYVCVQIVCVCGMCVVFSMYVYRQYVCMCSAVYMCI